MIVAAGMRSSILSRRNRRLLWVGRVLLAGCAVFIPATGGFLVWFWLDNTE